jgi:putative aminopeptidase FrvX
MSCSGEDYRGMNEPAIDFLLDLITISGVSGDEGAVADWLEARLKDESAVALHRIGDNLLALRGVPRTAVFAHTDTTGFTLGYNRELIRVGGPAPDDRERLRSTDGLKGRLRKRGGKREGQRERWELRRVRDGAGKKAEPTPGTRWVYAREATVEKGIVTSPYLDDRAGVWAAFRALTRCSDIAVAFCTGEEQTGHGARICADYLYRTHNISQALISDITWDTKETPCGKGVVLSARDGTCPRQRFLDRIMMLAKESGVAHQMEVQSAGGSDGSHIQRSAVPMDWVFVGAPEKDPHTSKEQVHLSDLDAMTDLLTYLVDHL